MGEVFHNIGVEAEYAKFVCPCYAREELHDEEFVFERIAFVVFEQTLVQLFAEALGIVEMLKGRKVRCGGRGIFLSFLENVMVNS